MAELEYKPGSVEDFDRLYRSSFNRILYTIYGILGDRAAAEDCTHDAFVRAFKAWKTWKPDAPAEAWLHRIAIAVALGAPESTIGSRLAKAKERLRAELGWSKAQESKAEASGPFVDQGDARVVLNDGPIK